MREVRWYIIRVIVFSCILNKVVAEELLLPTIVMTIFISDEVKAIVKHVNKVNSSKDSHEQGKA